MHLCPSCALDCDCDGGRERCEHLCLQFSDEESRAGTPATSRLRIAFDDEEKGKRFYADAEIATMEFARLTPKQIVERYVHPALAAVKAQFDASRTMADRIDLHVAEKVYREMYGDPKGEGEK